MYIVYVCAHAHNLSFFVWFFFLLFIPEFSVVQGPFRSDGRPVKNTGGTPFFIKISLRSFRGHTRNAQSNNRTRCRTSVAPRVLKPPCSRAAPRRGVLFILRNLIVGETSRRRYAADGTLRVRGATCARAAAV